MSFAAATKKIRSRIAHTPVSEQAILTPIPIWVETHDESVARVVLRYKIFGGTGWTAVDLTKAEGGWAGEVPCREVGTVTGLLRYYVTAYDAEGNSVGSQGTLKKPNKVKIRRAIKTEAPHLPGRPPPVRCVDKTDCPPEFPGCRTKNPGDNSCSFDDDCEEGLRCSEEKKCEPPPPKQKKNWLTFGATQDVVILSNSNECAPENQDSGQFLCLRQDNGLPYLGNPVLVGSAVTYGPAATRVFLGYDHFVASYVTLGVRFGYVVRGGAPVLPSRDRSLPLLAEGRVALWLSREATVRPMLFISGGYAPQDFMFHGFVREDPAAPPTGNPPSQTLDVWTTRGPWFAGGGFGVLFATSVGTGFLLEVEAVGAFPTTSTVIRPSLSFAIGF